MFKPKTINLETKHNIESLEQQRFSILNNFDFKTTAMIMASPCRPIWDDYYEKIQGYEPWYMWSNGQMKLFNPGELRCLAKKLLDEVIKLAKDNGDNVYMATGPFKAIYRYGILELDFVMETWSLD